MRASCVHHKEKKRGARKFAEKGAESSGEKAQLQALKNEHEYFCCKETLQDFLFALSTGQSTELLNGKNEKLSQKYNFRCTSYPHPFTPYCRLYAFIDEFGNTYSFLLSSQHLHFFPFAGTKRLHEPILLVLTHLFIFFLFFFLLFLSTLRLSGRRSVRERIAAATLVVLRSLLLCSLLFFFPCFVALHVQIKHRPTNRKPTKYAVSHGDQDFCGCNWVRQGENPLDRSKKENVFWFFFVFAFFNFCIFVFFVFLLTGRTRAHHNAPQKIGALPAFVALCDLRLCVRLFLLSCHCRVLAVPVASFRLSSVCSNFTHPLTQHIHQLDKQKKWEGIEQWTSKMKTEKGE